MSEKLPPSKDQATTGDKQQNGYVAPTLVRYGSMFVETGMVCSAAGTDDVSKCDIGDPDGGPVDGNM